MQQFEDPMGPLPEPISNVVPLRRVARSAFEIGSHIEVAHRAVECIESDAEPVYDLGKMHAYDGSVGTWHVVKDYAVKRIIHSFDGSPVGEKGKPLKLKSSDVNGIYKEACTSVQTEHHFANPTAGLAFANCFVRVEDGKLRRGPHDPEHRARVAYPFAFHVDAICPRWLKLLADAFQGDADADAKIACLQEFAGISLLGKAPTYASALVLYGAGANSKSTIIDVIMAAFPPESTCAIPPQKWDDDYRMAMLSGKLLNSVSELPEADILAAEAFKATVDGSERTAREIREAPFKFRAQAGHLFAANRLPATNDQSHGFWRRLIVLTFNRVLPAHEQIRDLAKEIVAAELPGIVTWMLRGAARLMRNGQYTMPSSSLEALGAWRHATDPISQFVSERTRPARDDSERTPAKAMFAAYVEHAESNRFRVMSSTTFGMRMRALGLGSEHTRTGQVYPVVILGIGESPPEPPDPAEDFDR